MNLTYMPASKKIPPPRYYFSDAGNAELCRQMKGAHKAGIVDGYQVWTKGTRKDKSFVIYDNSRIVFASRYSSVMNSAFNVSGFSEVYVWMDPYLDEPGLPRRIFWKLVWPEMKHLFILDKNVSEVGFRHSLNLACDALHHNLSVTLFACDCKVWCAPIESELTRYKRLLDNLLVNDWDEKGYRGLSFGTQALTSTTFRKLDVKDFLDTLIAADVQNEQNAMKAWRCHG